MGHHDQDPGHGEPGHVHDENWNRHMMETDDPQESRDTSDTDARHRAEDRAVNESESSEKVVYDR